MTFMKNLCLTFFAAAFIHLSCSAQEGWCTVQIEGFGTLALPPNMEIQGGVYRELSEKLKRIVGVAASQVIFQQKSLNDFAPNSFKTYARVMIRTVQGAPGDFHRLNETNLPEAEIKEINDTYKSDVYSSAPKLDAVLIEWHDAQSSTLNGYPCTRLGYIRKLKTNPCVLNNTYIVQNHDRLHIVNLEYRIIDSQTWHGTFEKIIQSLTIIQQP